jgi:hypothetical protein
MSGLSVYAIRRFTLIDLGQPQGRGVECNGDLSSTMEVARKAMS